MTFSDEQLAIARFCAVECKLQMSGEESVGWMLNAWNYALRWARKPPYEVDILELGGLVEPRKNSSGYRQVGVRMGWDVIPRRVKNLASAVGSLDPAEWFRQYEEIHPFVDGNGRTGQILFNWLSGTLDAPTWAPNFWDDDRRVEGAAE